MTTITDGGDPAGVPHGTTLLAFAEAMVGDDDGALDSARRALMDAAGAAAMVDAAGVASNFERMVRIADATGIPLGQRLENSSSEVRQALALDRLNAGKDL